MQFARQSLENMVVVILELQDQLGLVEPLQVYGVESTLHHLYLRTTECNLRLLQKEQCLTADYPSLRVSLLPSTIQKFSWLQLVRNLGDQTTFSLYLIPFKSRTKDMPLSSKLIFLMETSLLTSSRKASESSPSIISSSTRQEKQVLGSKSLGIWQFMNPFVFLSLMQKYKCSFEITSLIYSMSFLQTRMLDTKSPILALNVRVYSGLFLMLQKLLLRVASMKGALVLGIIHLDWVVNTWMQSSQIWNPISLLVCLSLRHQIYYIQLMILRNRLPCLLQLGKVTSIFWLSILKFISRARYSPFRVITMSNYKTNICCRESFQWDEVLDQEQNHTFEFKHIDLFNKNPINDFNVKKTICGMLNCFGGYLFLGVEQNPFDKSHIVRGLRLNENQREILKKYFNSTSECFYPRVDTSQKQLQVTFIPVKSKDQNRFVPKIRILKGKNNKFYSFKHRVAKLKNGEDGQIQVNLHFKRYDNESKLVSSMGQIYREILERNQLQPQKGSSLCRCKMVESLQPQFSPYLPSGMVLHTPKPRRVAKQSTEPNSVVANNTAIDTVLNQKYTRLNNHSFESNPGTSGVIVSEQIPFDLKYQDAISGDQTSDLRTFHQGEYKYTLITNIPEEYEEPFQELVYMFNLVGILSNEPDGVFKTYKVPLQSRDEHQRLRKAVQSWLLDLNILDLRQIEVTFVC